jgi:Asp/Glu/hydantoin racemase
MARLRYLIPALGLVALSCVTVNKSVLSRARVGQPVLKEDVQVYFADDSVPTHERIAILNAEGDETFADESKLIDKMREEAGKLGANAIILGEIKDPSTAAKVASVIVGTSAMRKGQALAIFVPSLQKPRAPG